MTKTKAAKRRARKQKRAQARQVAAPARPRKLRPARVLVRAPAPRAVGLNYSMVPRSRISASRLTSDGFQEVRGTEVFATVVTPDNSSSFTNTRSNQGFLMNPSYPHFQRLSGIAQSYQKFRFRKLEFTYHPACPTTRSGVCSLAYIENPLEGAPDSNPSFASFDCSFTGSIGIPMRTKVENQGRDLKWYYTESWKSLSSDLDPTSYQQGVVWVCCSDAVTADLELLAGYVSMSYVVEFDDLRPVRDIALNVQPRDFTVSAGGGLTVPWVNWLGGIGDFGWTPQPAPLGAPSTQFKEENFWFDAGLYTVANLLEWSGVTFESQRSPRPGFGGGRREISLVDDRGRVASPSLATRRLVCVNGVRQHDIPPGWLVAEGKHCSHVADGMFVSRCSCKWWEDPRGPMIRAPMAAGDVTLSWSCQANDGTNTFIRTQIDSLGTSAATSRDMFVMNVAPADAPCRLRVTADTDGTETRSVTGADSYLTITGYEE